MSIHAVSSKINSTMISNEELIKEVDAICNLKENEHFRLINVEFFLTSLERNLIPHHEYLEIHKILSLIFYSNRSLSIHFSNPSLAGSFQYDCANRFNLVVDIILYHSISKENMKEGIEQLVSKFKVLVKDNSNLLLTHITNRLNETNLDLIIRFKYKPFSFRFIIRDDEFKQFIYYLKTHNNKVNRKIDNPSIFISLRRLFRFWR